MPLRAMVRISSCLSPLSPTALRAALMRLARLDRNLRAAAAQLAPVGIERLTRKRNCTRLIRTEDAIAIIFIHNVEIGLVHPPVGLKLCVLSSIAVAPMSEAIRGILPFLVILLIVLAIIICASDVTL